VIKRIIIISLLPYITYLGVGYFYIDKEFKDILFLSIFFLIGLFFFSFIMSLLVSKKIKIKIIDYKSGKDGMPNMTPVGSGKIYTFTYILNSAEYKERTFYSSMTKYNIGDIGIAYKYKKLIVIQGDLFKLSFFAIFPMIFSLILLIL